MNTSELLKKTVLDTFGVDVTPFTPEYDSGCVKCSFELDGRTYDIGANCEGPFAFAGECRQSAGNSVEPRSISSVCELLKKEVAFYDGENEEKFFMTFTEFQAK